VEDAVALVMKVMSKTMDSTTLGSEKRKPFHLRNLLAADSDFSGIRNANIRSRDQEAPGQNLSASRSGCTPDKAWTGQKGGRRDEMSVSTSIQVGSDTRHYGLSLLCSPSRNRFSDKRKTIKINMTEGSFLHTDFIIPGTRPLPDNRAMFSSFMARPRVPISCNTGLYISLSAVGPATPRTRTCPSRTRNAAMARGSETAVAIADTCGCGCLSSKVDVWILSRRCSRDAPIGREMISCESRTVSHSPGRYRNL